jgi:hypothetical protein
MIYTDQQDPMAGLGHPQTVVMNLLDGLEGCYRTVVADNFFNSISLAKHLLELDTYLIGILRSNRARSESEVVEKRLRCGEIYGLQNKDDVKLIQWKDKKDVLMISTRPSHSATVVNTGNINSENERIMKPQVVLDYNEGRQGTDLSDQLSAYYTCLRKSIKWVPKVGILIGSCDGNSKYLFDIQGKLRPKQSDHSTVSRKSCPIFTAWCAVREAEAGCETETNWPSKT